MSVKLGLSY